MNSISKGGGYQYPTTIDAALLEMEKFKPTKLYYRINKRSGQSGQRTGHAFVTSSRKTGEATPLEWTRMESRDTNAGIVNVETSARNTTVCIQQRRMVLQHGRPGSKSRRMGE